MKNRTQVLSIIAIAIILINIIFLNIPLERNNVFWWSYGFTNLAFIVQFFIWDNLVTDIDIAKSQFLYLPIISVSSIYLIIQLFVTWRLLLIPYIQEWMAIIVYSLIFGVALICMLATNLGTKEIQRVDNTVATKVNFIRSLQSDVEILIQKEESKEIKNALQELYDKIRYSDPMGNDFVRDIEYKIQSKILEINSSDDKMSLIKNIIDLVTERNVKLKNFK